MDTVHDLLQRKGDRPLVATSPSASVREATLLMNEHGIGSLLVLRDDRLVGIFTERDVLRRVVAESRPPDTTPVLDVMTTEVICCRTDTPVDDVAALMRSRRIRHVPVIGAGGGVIGLVSIGDVNALRFATCEVALHQAEDYILRRS
jgi:CBS domain-containing protein